MHLDIYFPLSSIIWTIILRDIRDIISLLILSCTLRYPQPPSPLPAPPPPPLPPPHQMDSCIFAIWRSMTKVVADSRSQWPHCKVLRFDCCWTPASATSGLHFCDITTSNICLSRSRAKLEENWTTPWTKDVSRCVKANVIAELDLMADSSMWNSMQISETLSQSSYNQTRLHTAWTLSTFLSIKHDLDTFNSTCRSTITWTV